MPVDSPPKTRLPLFCFPFGGAGASSYRSWSQELPSWIDVRPMQIPGRENRFREPSYTHIEPLVAEMVEKLAPERPPYAFFGHSLGGLVAYELTRELRRRGRPAPVLLIISGYGAPHLPRDHRPPVSHLGPEAFWEAMKADYDVTPEVMAEPMLRDLVYPILRADLEVVETYPYKEEPPLSVPLLAMGGETDPEARPDEIAAWKEHSRLPVEVRIFPGGHFFLQGCRREVLETIAAAARKVIE
ncbi:MAG TPA: alpha/beta fold hydrolase [Thermoanaerobaculia bacterium]|nr:alpha/beta fold hydrolase [Thermoanaerobaculia bacterium]